MKSLKRVIISGGGTGGHIFPALSVANEISKRHPQADILFVGALGRMEMERVPAAGYEIIGLPVVGLPRKISLSMISFLFYLQKSNKLAKKIINQFNPQVAIGVGGYASGPLLRAAINKRVPALIQEQNSYAGITNKLLGKRADRVCVAYEGMERFFPKEKIVFTGNPIRDNLFDLEELTAEAVNYFGLKKSEKVIVIVGGSLGARTINRAVLAALPDIADFEGEVIWQTGSIYYDDIKEKLKGETPPNLHIVEFITRMDLAYAVAGVIVSRAGAGTISELCVVGKPVILIPSPNVAEDHQTKNAKALSDVGAAVMISDEKAENIMISEAVALINDNSRCRELAKQIKLLAKPDATKQIVDEIEKLVEVNGE